MSDFESQIKRDFLSEAKELLLNAEQCFLDLERDAGNAEVLNNLFRLAHNLKGSSGAVGFLDLADFIHKLESLLLGLKEKKLPVTQGIIDLLLRSNDYLARTIETLLGDLSASYANPNLANELCLALHVKPTSEPQTEENFQDIAELARNSLNSPPPQPAELGHTSMAKAKDDNIRVSLSRIEKLLNNIGELSILQAVVSQQSLQRGTAIRPLMREAISAMSKIIRETQGISMGLRMLPVKQTFQKMQRIVRDTSNTLGKEVELHLSGEDTEIDKTVLESLSDPLVHIIRNAVDHGLECPDSRISAGKATKGHIYLSAFHRAGHIVIEIKDDGQGLDAGTLTAKAKQKKFISPDAVLTSDQAYQLVFTPGFSTKECVTEVSGRGVGMDVVKTNVSALQGKIEIETERGKGTCFRIVLPLTLAIIDSIIVRCGEERYVIPLSQVSEFFCPTESEVAFAYGRSEFLSLRGEPLGTFRLSSLIKQKPKERKDAWTQTALIVSNGSSSKFAVMVDKVIAQQQVVIKALGNELKNRPGLMGSAILGDGKPAFILDLLQLTEPYRSSDRKERNGSEHTMKMEVA